MTSELFARIRTEADGERRAVDAPEGTLSYAELLRRAERLAGIIAAHRTAPILIYGHKEPAMVISIVAALRLGRPYVPIDPVVPVARVARMIEVVQPGTAIIAQAPPPVLEELLRQAGVSLITVDPLGEELDRLAGDNAALVDVSVPDLAEMPAYILFTSGTTGDPKGVPVPYRALRHFTCWLIESQRFAPRAETFLNQAPFNFDLSVMDLYGALLTGGTLFSITRDDIAKPRLLFGRLESAPLTVWVSTPSFAQFCVAEPRFRQEMLPTLRTFLFCGETLAPSLATELLRRFPNAEVWNTYGPTETTVAVTAVQITAKLARANRPLPVGHPAPGVDVWVVDPAEPEQPLPLGAPGEIVIAGPQVALGYLHAGSNQPAAGKSAFLQLPDGRVAYRTGDLGHLDATDRCLYWDGRIDRQIKLHGYRLELEEIEAFIRQVPGIAEAVVLAPARDGRPDYLAAFVVASADPVHQLPSNQFELTQHVRARLSEHLPPYALPRVVRMLESLPLTANGKLDRRRLQETLE